MLPFIKKKFLLVVRIKISWNWGFYLHEDHWTEDSKCLIWSHHLVVLRSLQWLDYRYGLSVSQIIMDIFCWSQSRPPYTFHDITEFITRITQWVPLVEQEQHSLSHHISSIPFVSEVRVAQSVLCIVLSTIACLLSSFF